MTTLLVVQKYFNDNFFGNYTFSKIGGIKLAELNMLE